MRKPSCRPWRSIPALSLAAVLAACAPGGSAPNGAGLGGTLDQNPVETSGLVIGLVPTTAPPVSIGERIGFSVRSSQGGFASLYLVSSNGVTTALTENLILGPGSPALYPVPGSGIAIEALPPAGQNRVVLLVTRAPFNGAGETGPVTVPTALGLTADQLIQRLNDRTEGLDQSTWAVAETLVAVNP